MDLFASCGIEPEEIWRLATSAAGEARGGGGPEQAANGAPADFLVLARDPTGELGALETLQAVVARGRLYRVTDPEAAIARRQRHFTRTIFDRLSVAAARREMSKPLGRP